MWTVILLMVVFQGNDMVQVVEPMPGTRFETVEVCERVSQKFLAMPLPEGHHAVAVCVSP
jgi:hypothetical protein